MTDFVWPSDLVPYAQSFYLQPHIGGSQSPFSKQTKVYGLSAPRWICAMSFRGGYKGTRDHDAFGPRLDAFIAKLRGRQNRVALYDFRRVAMRGPFWPAGVGNSAASAGDTQITLTGLSPGQPIYCGDYLGGDGRPHIIVSDDGGLLAATADGSGEATIDFEPPLSADIAGDSILFASAATGLFRLTDDDQGANGVQVGDAVNITLNFVEDPSA